SSYREGDQSKGEVKLWDVVTGQQRATLHGHTGLAYSVAFSGDGTTLASAGGVWDAPRREWLRGELRLWAVSTGAARAALQGHARAVSAVASSADGKTREGGRCDEAVRLWDVATGQERATLRGHTGWVWSVAFSADGKTLASGSGANLMPGEVKLWNPATGQEQVTLKSQAGLIRCVAFSPDDQTLATGGADGVHLRAVAGALPAH